MTVYDSWIGFIDNIGVLQRAGMAFFSSFIIILCSGKYFIRFLKKKLHLQPIRQDGPTTHYSKKGTPTLGGIIIMMAFFLSVFIWVKDFNKIVTTILIVGLLFAILGLIDDLLKLRFKNTKGLPGIIRLILGFLIGLWGISILIKEYPASVSYSIYFPYITPSYFYIGTGIFLFAPFVILGAANSVNLTDGLDGLASMVVLTILIAFFIVVFLVLSENTHRDFEFNSIFYYAKLEEVLILIAAMIGALFGFLWFNSAPAKIFMGDIGSLGIGGILGAIAVSLKYELFLAVAGLILILETLSVIIQVYYYKFTKKRVFLMAPLHHHFEKKGYSEIKIVKRIWIFTLICSIIGILFLAQ